MIIIKYHLDNYETQMYTTSLMTYSNIFFGDIIWDKKKNRGLRARDKCDNLENAVCFNLPGHATRVDIRTNESRGTLNSIRQAHLVP
jgi:hypothetical protein